MAADDDKIIEIHFQEAFTFQKCFRMQSDNFTYCNFIFDQEVCGIVALDKGETIFVEWTMYGNKLLNYRFDYKSPVQVTVAYAEFQASISGIKKKDSLILTFRGNEMVMNVKPIINGTQHNYDIKLHKDITYSIPEIPFDFKFNCKDVSTKWSTPLYLAKKAGSGALIKIRCLGPKGVNIAVIEDNMKPYNTDFGDLSLQYRKNKSSFHLNHSIFNSLAVWKDISLPGALTQISIDPGHGMMITQDCGVYSEFKITILNGKR